MVWCWQCCFGAARCSRSFQTLALQPSDVVALFYQFLVPRALSTAGGLSTLWESRLTNSPLRRAAIERLEERAAPHSTEQLRTSSAAQLYADALLTEHTKVVQCRRALALAIAQDEA